MAVTKNILRVHLVNSDVRAVKYEDEDDCTRIIHSLLSRLGANLSVSLQFFGLEMMNPCTKEKYWLTPGVPVADFIRKYLRLPLDDWKFELKLKILPKTPQHLCSKDKFAYLYLYEQVLHRYLDDSELKIDNDTAIKLGCLELRRFYRDLPQIALSRPENFKILEKEIGLQKFFRKSVLHSVKAKNLRKSVLQYFKEYEGLTDEGCVDRFFALVSKYMSYDMEVFPKCSVEEVGPLSSEIRIGPNCDVEVQKETGECKLIALFQDITEVRYQPGIGARGQLVISTSLVNDPLVVRTGLLAQAMNMANIIEGYCQCVTGDKQPRARGYSAAEKRISPLPPLPREGELRPPMPLPPDATPRGSAVARSSEVSYSMISSTYSTYSTTGSEFDDYAEISERELMASESYWFIPYDKIIIEEKIGEGQFGDVHVGKVTSDGETVEVAIKSCKMATTQEEKMKFMREAIVMKEFTHPHIIKLHGWTHHSKDYCILMELAPYGELRNFLITNSGMISTLILISYISQLGSAMSYLEAMNYVHRDIAARNLLLVTPGIVKLGDFGLSRWLDEGAYYIASRGKLPIKWMAPESIYYRRFTTASDVWMFGVCAWEILMKGVKPFLNVKNQDVVGRIENGERLPLPAGCPPSLYRLMMKCWSHDPLDRPTFADIDHKLKEILDIEKKSASPSEQERLNSPLPLNFATTLSLPRGTTGFRNGSISDSDDDVDPIRRSKSPMEFHQEQQWPPHSPPLTSPLMGEFSSPSPNLPQRTSSDAGIVRDHLANRPLPPPPGEGPANPEPTYSPIRKRTNRSFGSSSDHKSDECPEEEDHGSQRKISEEDPYSALKEEEDPYSYVTVKDQSGIPDDFVFRPLPTPPPDDGSEDEEGPSVEDRTVTEPTFFDQDTYEVTMTTVKAVVQLSQAVPVKEVSEYASLVMDVGKPLRELVQKVEEIRETLPESKHQEIHMAVKMVNSDMMRLFKSMKSCQQYQQTNVVDDYKRQMLQEAHCLGQNVKSLFHTINAAEAAARA